MVAPLDLTFYPNLGGGAIWAGLPLAATPEEDQADPNHERRMWLWSPRMFLSLEGTLENISALMATGWERMPARTLSRADMDLYHFWTQLREVRGLQVRNIQKPSQHDPSADKELWARSDDLRAVQRTPVALTFNLGPYPSDKSAFAMFSMQRTHRETYQAWVPETLPPPTLGTYGLVWIERERAGALAPGWQIYSLDDLKPEAHERQAHMAEAIRELAAPHVWYMIGPSMQEALDVVAQPLGYTHKKAEIQSNILAHQGKMRELMKESLHDLNIARERHELMSQARRKYPPDIWLERWGGIQEMAQQLAVDYWEHHQNTLTREPRPRTHGLPPLTSGTRTRLASDNHTRALTQTFGPGLRTSLWNLEPGNSIELHTPNNALVRLDAQDANENAALHLYVSKWLKPEGLKHMIGLMDAYYLQTQGHDQKADARVSLRQLLLRMGKSESQADDQEEQKRLMHTIFYLSHSYVTADEKRMVEDGRRKSKKRTRREYSPLLVIERVQFEEDGQLRIPTEAVFHLGADYYALLFGEDAQYFTVPSAALLQYHAEREQHELILGIYLCNHITMSGGTYSARLHTIMLQSGLRSTDDLASGHDRLDDAQRALMALERLERDGFHRRHPHPDIDIVCAATLALGKCQEEQLAPATLERLRTQPYTNIRHLDTTQLRERRRRVLQRLLDAAAVAAPITFEAGPLLREQATKRAAQRQAAIERDERVLAARVAKRAIPQVVDAIQGANTGQRRRGRPRKTPNGANN